MAQALGLQVADKQEMREQRAQLISRETNNAVHAAFNALQQTVLTNKSQTLDDLIREMLRPILRAWIDDNLPGMVERLVRVEIEQISKPPAVPVRPDNAPQSAASRRSCWRAAHHRRASPSESSSGPRRRFDAERVLNHLGCTVALVAVDGLLKEVHGYASQLSSPAAPVRKSPIALPSLLLRSQSLSMIVAQPR
jgi:Protein of unknown function (DUF2497)